MLTSKHVVAQLNSDPSKTRLATVAPRGLPAVLDYPVLRVSGSGDDPVVSAGADLVAAALTAPDALQLTRAAGFDAPSRTVAPTTPQGRAAAKAAMAQVNAFVAQVRAQAVPSRLLILMDVSGSMGLRVRPGLSRGRLASSAALSAGRLLPDDSTIGLWKFAGAQPDGRAYAEVAPIDDLGSIEGGQTHRDIVNGALAALPRQLSSGGTALYDATLAAVRAMRESYDPASTNAVVVFTDGANEYPDGITLRQFRQAVQADARANPDRPIVLVLIGIGPAADMPSLRAMAAPVNGRAYKADNPNTLRVVLFDAIAHRARAKD
jgi:Mg-chelatase subunit ChlD